MTYRYFAIVMLAITGLFSLEAVTLEPHEPPDHDEHESGVVNLTDAELAEFGISLETAGPGTIRNEIVVPGEVEVNGDRIAHIFPRFTGVVTKVFKRIGDHVPSDGCSRR